MPTPTEDRLIRIFTTILKCDVNKDTSQQNTPQWDSLKHISLVFAVEDEFDVQFDEADLPTLNSVSAFIDKIG